MPEETRHSPPEDTPRPGSRELPDTVRRAPSPPVGSVVPPSGSRRGPAEPPEIASAPPSARFGNFVRTGKLGAGGMGEVWKAWDTKLGRWVALKFLHAEDDTEIERFVREARTAGALTHPNIAAIYEIGESNGRHWIAMQYVAGSTLRKTPRNDRRKVVSLLRDAARAVAHANAEGIVHRDLKPDNLMVDESGHGSRLYVMDFGLARAVEGESSLSVTGSPVGTPAYMPPEQGRGERADARSDVYGLGATLYELLCGRPPFREKSIYETLRAVQEQEPPALRGIEPRVPPDLETIVLKCLEKDRERRYATAGDLADDLDAWLEGRPIAAHPPSIRARAARFLSRRKAVLIPATSAVILLLAAAGWGIHSSSRRSARVHGLLEEASRREAGGDWQGARDAFSDAAQLDRSSLRASEGLKRAELAIAAAKASLEKNAAEARLRESALKTLEAGRPALDRAFLSLYDRNTSYDAMVRKVDDAQRLIEEALAGAPDLVLGHFHLGRAWELKGRLDRAESEYRTTLRLDSSFAPAHSRLGAILLQRSYLARLEDTTRVPRKTGPEAERLAAEAEKEFSAALAAGGALDEEIQRDVAAALLAYARRDSAEAARLAAAGVARHGMAQGSEEFHWLAGLTAPEGSQLDAYNRAIEIRPKFALALACRAMRRASAGDLSGARDDFSVAIEVNPGTAELWVSRGVILEDMGELPASLADTEKAIALKPGFLIALLNRGNILRKMGREPEALQAYADALAAEPAFPEVFNNRGSIHLERNRLAEAEADFTQAIVLAKEYRFPYGGRAQTRRRTRDWAGTAADYTEMLRIDPADAETWRERAEMNYRLQKYAEAIADATEAVRRVPTDARALDLRSLCRQRSGDADGAIEDATAAISLDDRDPWHWIHRAQARHLKGELDAALADYDTAVERNPKLVEAYLYRSEAWKAKGEKARALADLRTAGEMAPPDWPKRAVLEKAIEDLEAGR